MPSCLDLLRPELAAVRPYLPTPGNFRIRLDANEAPPLLPPSVKARLAEEFARIALERYPDATAGALRAAIAARLGVDPSEVLLGVGSDELITLLLTAVTRPRRGNEPATVLTTTPTFVMYRMSARLRGQVVIEVPLDAAWEVAESSLLRGIEVSVPHVIFLASPNNPTGTVVSPESLERIVVAARHSLVVIDEAYVNYADRDQVELFRRYDNVVILRTLSKIGFAALRVGWLVGRRELVAELDKVRLPYNLSTVSQNLATLVLGELWDTVTTLTAEVKRERARLASALAALPGLSVTPSQANFLWVKTERPAEALFGELAERGILVRSFHASAGRLSQQLRITVGTSDDNDELLRCLGELS